MKIITGSLDYSLKFWDLSTGKVRTGMGRTVVPHFFPFWALHALLYIVAPIDLLN